MPPSAGWPALALTVDDDVYVLTRAFNPDAVADTLRGFGGTVIHTTLNPELR